MKFSTGIEGLDEMLGGGLQDNTITVIHGGPGSGKTILSFQFIVEGVKRNERGLYVTLEEPIGRIKFDMSSFGWDLDGFLKREMLLLEDASLMVYGDLSSPADFPKSVTELVKKFNAKRLVIDPLTSVVLHQRFPTDKRIEIGRLFKNLRGMNCTTIVTSEITSEGEFYMEEYLADGVILLSQTITSVFQTVDIIRILKMRGIKHDRQPRRYEITNKGIKIYNTEPVIT